MKNGTGCHDFVSWMLSFKTVFFFFHSSLSPSSRGFLAPLHFFPLEWYYLHIWKMKVAQSCLTRCGPMDYRVHGILQARILAWVAFPFCTVSSWPRNWTRVSYTAGGFFTDWAIREIHIWGCWYFYQQSWFQPVIHSTQHLARCTLHRA